MPPPSSRMNQHSPIPGPSSSIPESHLLTSSTIPQFQIFSPNGRTIKKMLAEAAIVIGILLLVGNLSVYFWEKYYIQSELSNVKSSLLTLKETITNIGDTYDALRNKFHKKIEKEFEKKYNLDRRKLNEAIDGQKLSQMISPEKFTLKPQSILKKNNVHSKPNKDTSVKSEDPYMKTSAKPKEIEGKGDTKFDIDEQKNDDHCIYEYQCCRYENCETW